MNRSEFCKLAFDLINARKQLSEQREIVEELERQFDEEVKRFPEGAFTIPQYEEYGDIVVLTRFNSCWELHTPAQLREIPFPPEKEPIPELPPSAV